MITCIHLNRRLVKKNVKKKYEKHKLLVGLYSYLEI